MVKTFRIVAVLEAISYLILLAFVLVKYTKGDEAGVQLMGPIHGSLVLVYAGLVLGLFQQQRSTDLTDASVRGSVAPRTRLTQRWGLKAVVLLLLASALPFGGFYAERRIATDRNDV